MLKEFVRGDIDKAGVYNELDYWRLGTPTAAGTIMDNMQASLVNSGSGYHGHPKDAFRKWAEMSMTLDGNIEDYRDGLRKMFKCATSTIRGFVEPS